MQRGGLLPIAESDGRLDPTWQVFRGVRNITPVVAGQTVLEFLGEPDVKMFGEGF